MSRIEAAGLSVAQPLHAFIVDEALPGSGVEEAHFFEGLASVLAEFGPRQRALLHKRDELQAAIDDWHRTHPGSIDPHVYRAFLTSIGYLVEVPVSFEVTVDNVDPEIARLAGPQLVVPVNNARFALNAANARWGSLYDALYGSDAISDADDGAIGARYNEVRGQRVIARAQQMLDDSAPLVQGGYAEATGFRIEHAELLVTLASGSEIGLKDPSSFAGYRGKASQPAAILLTHHGLHLEIVIDRHHPIGRGSPAGIADLVLEAAISTIQDCEDLVAAVDAEDKVGVYRNWLGLMQGTLVERFEKSGQEVVRTLAADREYVAPDGGVLRLPGRSVMLVRNVGAHLLSDVVLDPDGQPVVETIIDAMVTALAAMHDLAKSTGEPRNSRSRSVYIVKPKQHGPDEVALSCELFARVEAVLGLPARTLKIGLMDEERRTSCNLAACIAAAADRLVFINTGFLDRTGDEYHTDLYAGLMVPKHEMSNSVWLAAYEDNNIDVGLAAGLPGRGQIGKGMWDRPDRMAEMLAAKQVHPESGANTAWVPSPTAAVLHALHYHAIDVEARQQAIASRAPASLDALLTIPLVEPGREFSPDEILRELDNNMQSILGYVVRWVNQGIGCSTVRNIDDVGLMEDRATLRISSQFLTNWMHHGLIDEAQLRDAMERMALVVDHQNAGDDGYEPMAPDFDSSQAFLAAVELVRHGAKQPNGYTGFVLSERRRAHKAHKR